MDDQELRTRLDAIYNQALALHQKMNDVLARLAHLEGEEHASPTQSDTSA